MKVRVIMLDKNDDIEFSRGILEGILAAYNITEFVNEEYTPRREYYQFITTDDVMEKILEILKKKNVRHKEANIKIEFE